MAAKFPVPIENYVPLKINPFEQKELTAAQVAALKNNIQLCRDTIVFFTACGSASGYGGHTGGAFDTVPEVMLLDSFFRACPDKFVPIFFDEAGHRVATQYLVAVLRGQLDANRLKNYRSGHSQLPGHPELHTTPGVQFSSGRLGHLWPLVNGVAMANPDKILFCLGSDGAQQEGNDAEAARLAAALGLNVKLLIDDNNVTISGHPSAYLKGYSVSSTLRGHGIPCYDTEGEDIIALYRAMRAAVTGKGPAAVVCKRPMAPGVKGIEGTCEGHDAVAVKHAIPYLEARALHEAVAYLKTIKKTADPKTQYFGSGKKEAARKQFGVSINKQLAKMSKQERKEKVVVIDCDLEGSTGLDVIHKTYPEVFVAGGIMERGNFSAAAGFGMAKGKQGIFSTFAAFLEMCVSEITMARLNFCNVLCHFSHSGSDDMADNTCHFGINNFFADNGLEDGYDTKLYFPADAWQLDAVVERVFNDPGLRFVFSTRSSLPQILDDKGHAMYGEGYKFVPGKDELLREGKDGCIVAFGDAVYRALDAVERLKNEGLHVALVNKPTLNVVDEEMMKSIGAHPFVLVVEPFNTKSGLGIRFGTWLLQRGYAPKYAIMGAHKEGSGGLWEHAYHQGYDSDSIMKKAKELFLSKTVSRL
eukprot:gb/GEZN01003552.1/.p1 GENE.gb/GEZN01003552.1/~~gb/GEZN01003552.1/.p1  ORF type:complete len:643 (+),score=92.40 gb/GEZN01003552.1/:40-1968(+)